jgi:hypothetical protein
LCEGDSEREIEIEREREQKHIQLLNDVRSKTNPNQQQYSEPISRRLPKG